MAAKTSILIFYLRLSKNTQRVLRLASYAVLAIVNVAGTVLTFINIFQCQPVDAAFNSQKYGQAQCIPLLTEFICSAPVNIVTDLAILALPLPVLTSMRLPSRQKTILIFTFALGIFVTVVDVIRIFYLQQAIINVSTGASSDPNSIFGDSSEFSWNASLSLMWSAVEVNVGITCACIPTLKPLIIKILPAMITDPDGTRNASDTRDVETSKHFSKEGVQTSMSHAHPAAPGTTQSQNSEEDPDGVTMLDFLTTPDMLNNTSGGTNSIPQRNRLTQQLTATSIPTVGTRGENSVYFGFVNIKRPKSMLKTSASESFKYCTVVTILFFLWGFSYGLLNTLNNVIAAVSHMSQLQTLGLTSAYFGGGYLFGPLLVGGWVLRHDEHRRTKRRSNASRHEEPIGGFKATFMVGLCVYGTGTIMFWPSAVLTSFPGFLISNFVVGFGLAILETAANPFLALCGPMQYAEMRLLLAQGVQGVGSVLSGLLAQNVYFGSIATSGYTDSMTLLDVQWTYLAITLLSVALALLFYYMPLPEVSDAELEKAASYLPVDTTKRSFGGFSLRTVCLVLAVLANWFYVAGQETMSIFAHALLTSWLPTGIADDTSLVESGDGASSSNTPSSPDSDQPEGFAISIPNYLLLAHTGFTLSRFVTGYLAYLHVRHPTHRLIPTPRTMLSWCAGLTALASLLLVVLRPKSNPNLIVIPVVVYHTFEGPIWPLVFAMGLRGQGAQTKRAAAWLTVGGSGPAFWPYVMYAIINGGGNVQMAFVLVVVFYLVTLTYPLYLTIVKDARQIVEPGAEPQQRVADAERSPSGAATTDEVVAKRRSGHGGKGLMGRLGRRKGSASAGPAARHVEELGSRSTEEGGTVATTSSEEGGARAAGAEGGRAAERESEGGRDAEVIPERGRTRDGEGEK
jgi:fucose permease